VNSEAPTKPSPASSEKAKLTGTEKPTASPHRICEEDVKAGIHDLNDFKKSMLLDEPERVVDWNRLSESLSDFSPEIADFLDGKLKEAGTDDERQRLAETVFVVYWAAKFAHDPNHRLEYCLADVARKRENENIVLVEAVKV
jgi:hypothetical protein